MKISKENPELSYSDQMENFDYKIHIPGNLLFKDRQVIKVDDSHEIYSSEFNSIEKYLLKVDKKWSDIEELKYICGLREPYHQNTKVLQEKRICTTIDGYTVYIKFKKN